MGFFIPYLKALAGFLCAVATNAVMDLQHNGHPFPTDWGSGLRWLGSIAVTTYAVYQVPYKGNNPPPPTSAKHAKP